MLVTILTRYGALLVEAMGQTLLLALCGLFFACILGLFFGLLSVLRSRVCNIISTIFVDIIRGVKRMGLEKLACNHCAGWVWAQKAHDMGLPIVLGSDKYKEYKKAKTDMADALRAAAGVR